MKVKAIVFSLGLDFIKNPVHYFYQLLNSNNDSKSRKDNDNEAYRDVVKKLEKYSRVLELCILASVPKKDVLYNLKKAHLPMELFNYIQGSKSTNVDNLELVTSYLSELGIDKEEIVFATSEMDEYISLTDTGVRFASNSTKVLSASSVLDIGNDMFVSFTEILDVTNVVKDNC